MTNDQRRGPLAGVRILDLTRLLPGPYATMLLRSLGAEVVKIEDTQQGDYLRTLSPSVFAMLNAGNRSVALDLKQNVGRALFARLLAQADALIEGFRPGVAARLGVAYPQLREQYPRLVYCSVTGYGQTGPYADWPGHDVNYQGIAGSLALDDFSGERLRQAPILPVADVASAYSAALAITAALVGRASTGQGIYLDVS
ncbi:MAG TPA: CoA transferase, partial [Ktedonobacterales bacterium]|nr:CoA transferase [Ktedonobacterales bacterium]